MSLMVSTCDLKYFSNNGMEYLPIRSQVLVKVLKYLLIVAISALYHELHFICPLSFQSRPYLILWKISDQSLSAKKLHTPLNPDFQAVIFSTFLTVDMKSLYISRYLAVFLQYYPCFVLAS